MHNAPVHDHGNGRAKSARRLALTLALTASYTVAEAIGGWLTGSLALLADAGHMLSDVAALGLSLVAIRLAQRPPTARRTFGYHRAEILVALANAAALIAIAALILIEAWQRLGAPSEVKGVPMLLIATGGLAVNLAAVAILAGSRAESLNVRGAWLHVVTDALGSVQAIAAGVLIAAFGWTWADPLASILIALLVVYSAWSLLRETVDVLMEAVPRHIDPAEVRRALGAVEGVAGVHDLHVWTITSGFVALSAHVQASRTAPPQLLATLRQVLHDRFAIEHSTIQIEAPQAPAPIARPASHRSGRECP